jgi:hypothetical protein
VTPSTSISQIRIGNPRLAGFSVFSTLADMGAAALTPSPLAQGTITPAGAVATATSQMSRLASTQPRGITMRVRTVDTSTPEASEMAMP